MKYGEKAKVKILPKPSPMMPQSLTPSPMVSIAPSSGASTPTERPVVRKRARSAASTSTSTSNNNNNNNNQKNSNNNGGNISSSSELKKQRKTSTTSPVAQIPPQSPALSASGSTPKPAKQTGHRPVTSCTFCRQHKIKCNASDNYPRPCQRCDRMGLKCEIDPQFRPKKGSQIQSLKLDVDELKAKIEMLTKNESLLTQALNQHNLNFYQQQQQQQQQLVLLQQPSPLLAPQSPLQVVPPSVTTGVMQSQSPLAQVHPRHPPQPSRSNSYPVVSQHKASPMVSPSLYQNHGASAQVSPIPSITNIQHNTTLMNDNSDNSPSATNTPDMKDENYQPISEFILGDVNLPLAKANELHDRFMKKHLNFLPIIISRSATELYHKSNLLFWSVILTASLSEPEPTLYMSLASLIKQLAIETCWIRTPRSTHVIQALIILSIWPLPNEKVLDDCSYRFVGLAKNLSLQLGLHRGGEFIQEFSRNQVSLGPDAERWRTRSWLALFFCEQFWSSLLGLPPSINTTDYLLENARIDQSLPKEFRCLISLSIFQCKLVNVMGISVTRPDGLLEPLNRAASLSILDKELERLRFKLQFDSGSPIEVYYLYLKLMICCFAFLPGTPIEDQVKYVSSSYLSATRIVTIVSQMSQDISLIEMPIYIRQAVTYSVFLLFKLHLSKYLIDKYVDSARQSIVTVHRLFRNTLSSWKDLQNDISRTAKVLENLNIVLFTYPDIFMNEFEAGSSIITRMRSHLTASLFYDLVWCVHEARRRTQLDKSKMKKPIEVNDKRLIPLPFYNQITKDDFRTITTTTPNGTTVTTLVPTDEAMTQARLNAAENKPLEINGIPLAMLEATGSTRDGMPNNGEAPEASTQQPHQQDPHQQLVQQDDLQQLFDDGLSQAPIKLEQMPPQLPSQSQLFLQLPLFPYGAQSPPQQYLPTIDEDASNAMFMNQRLHPQQQQQQLQQHLQLQQQQQQQQQQHPQLQQQPMDIPMAGSFVSQIDSFFQQQSNGWMDNQDDDFLGWFDLNMLPDQ